MFASRLRKILSLEKEETPLVFLSSAYFFFLLSSYYILRPLRDEMGIRGGVEHLQWLFLGTFLAMLIAVPCYHALVSKFSRAKFLPWVYRFFILNILLFWLVFKAGLSAEWAARVFFVWTSTFNLFVVSVFWSFMVDVFRKEQAKRLFGFIAAGGTAGALAGPLLTMALTYPLGTVNLLLVSAFLLEMAVQCIRLILERSRRETITGEAHWREEDLPVGGNVFSGIRAIFYSPYLMLFCVFILLMTACATFVYFTQAWIISEAFETSRGRTTAFAFMDFFVNALTLFFQIFLTGHILTKAGLSFALALLPGITAAGFLGLAIAPVFPVLAVIQVLRRASNYAITHPARENLFTIVSREEKYKAKNFIDTVVYRGGDAVSGWVYHGLTAAGLTLPVVMAIGALLGCFWMITGVALGRYYQARRDR